MNQRYAIILSIVMLLVLSACATATQNPSPPDNSQGPRPVEPTPANNLAVQWERSGGITGICQRMDITRDGMYIIQDCQQSRILDEGRLSQKQRARLDEYLDRYQVFQWKFDPPEGSADMFVDKYTFYGQGDQIPEQESQQEIYAYLAELYQEFTAPKSEDSQPQESGISGQVLIGPTCAGPVPAVRIPSSQTVTLVAGKISQVVIRLDSGIR